MSGMLPPETPGTRHEILDPDELLGPDDVLDVEDADDVIVLEDPAAADVSDAELVDDPAATVRVLDGTVPAQDDVVLADDPVGTAPVAADAASVVSPANSEVAAVAPSAPDPSALEDVEVECPGCGLTVVGSDPRPTASWFCPRCDYPLYLVRKPAPPEPDGATRGARRRLPGTSGRAVTAAGPCWNCGEWNEAGVTTCLRCAATLPKPEAPRIVAEVIPPELEPELVEVEVMYWPPVWIALLGGFGTGIAFLAGVLLALGRL